MNMFLRIAWGVLAAIWVILGTCALLCKKNTEGVAKITCGEVCLLLSMHS